MVTFTQSGHLETEMPNAVEGPLNEQLISNKEALIKQAERLSEGVSFTPDPVPKKAFIMGLLKQIPLLSGFLHSLQGTGSSFSQLAVLRNAASPAMGNAFQFAGLGLAIIDFFRIPIIYLAAAILGERPPFSLSKNARWLYAAIIFALTIATLVVPGLAMLFAFVGAGLGVGVSLITLGKFFYMRNQIKANFSGLSQKIELQTKHYNKVQKEAASIKLELDSPYVDLAKQSSRIAALQRESEEVKTKLQELCNKQYVAQRKLEKYGISRVLDRSLAVLLSSGALVGLALFLVFPPIGLTIIGFSAALGGFYLIASLAYSFLRSSNALELSPTLTIKLEESEQKISEHEKQEVHESTRSIMLTLFDKQGASELPHHRLVETKLLEQDLIKSISEEDLLGVVSFFKNVAELAHHLQPEPHAIKTYLEHEAIEPALPLLNRAIERASAEEKEGLLSYEPLAEVLKSKGISLENKP